MSRGESSLRSSGHPRDGLECFCVVLVYNHFVWNRLLQLSNSAKNKTDNCGVWTRPAQCRSPLVVCDGGHDRDGHVISTVLHCHHPAISTSVRSQSPHQTRGPPIAVHASYILLMINALQLRPTHWEHFWSLIHCFAQPEPVFDLPVFLCTTHKRPASTVNSRAQ
jgi:hypothetical protein